MVKIKSDFYEGEKVAKKQRTIFTNNQLGLIESCNAQIKILEDLKSKWINKYDSAFKKGGLEYILRELKTMENRRRTLCQMKKI